MKKSKRLNRKKERVIDEIEQRRVIYIFIVTLLLFFIVFVKLSKVMILDGDKYKKSLKEISYKKVEGESTPRGRIYDRNYNIIVDNTAVKTIYYKKSKKIRKAR